MAEPIKTDDGYLVSRFIKDGLREFYVYLKFIKNPINRASNEGRLAIHIYSDDGTIDGQVGWKVSNHAYSNPPSMFWEQQASIFDDAFQNVFFSHAFSGCVNIENNNRQTFLLDDDLVLNQGRNWLLEQSHEAVQFQVTERMENNVYIEVNCDFPMFLHWVDPPEGSFPDGNYTWRSDNRDEEPYDRQISVFGSYDNLEKAQNASTTADTIDAFNNYYVTNYVYRNGQLVKSVNYNILAPADCKLVIRADVPHANDGLTSNAKFTASRLPIKLQTGASPIYEQYFEIPADLRDLFGNGNWTNFTNGDLYQSHLYTNVKIVYSTQEEEDFMRGLIPEDEEPEHPSNIGDKITAGDVRTNDVANIGSHIYLMSLAQMQEIYQDIIYKDDQSVIDSLRVASWLWGNNPIDFVISAYYVPFDVSEFYNTESKPFAVGNKIIFGNYDVYPRTAAAKGGKKITLFSTFFAPIYNDYRDYSQFKYELYLPFMSKAVELNVAEYLNKTVKCEMIFDATTHEVRYFLYCNGVLVDRVDCTVGISFPMTATDQVNKARNDINALTGGIGSGLSAAASLMVRPLQAPAVIGAAQSVANGIESLSGLLKEPSQQIVGGFSSALNTYDVRYAYLKITENVTIKPAMLNQLYGYPSFFVGQISSLRGYCEITDCRLQTTATESEQNEILSLLASGIII